MATPSLAMIPSAIADAKVYSVLPNNGDGDFQFNRDSSATRIGQNGLIQTVGYFGSEEIINGDFSNGGTNWSYSSSEWSFSSGLASCNGTQSGLSYLNQSGAIVSGKTYKATYEVVSISAGEIRIFVGGVSGIARTTTGIYNEYITAGSIDFWLRGSSTFIGSIDNVSVKEVTGDQPRLNYDISNGVVQSCPSLLLEPASTNLVTYSEAFDNSYWNKSGASVVGGFASPSADSPLGAFKLVFDGSDNFFYSSVSNTIDTSTIYIKGIKDETIKFGKGSNVSVGSLFTLSGEWQRLEYYNSTTSDYLLTLSTYSGATAREVYIFGAQVEVLSYATSYIPNFGQSAGETRAAESCFGAGTSSTFNSEEGTIYFEGSALSNDLTNRIMSINNGTSNYYVWLQYKSTSNTIRCVYGFLGVNQADFSTTIADVTLNTKIAMTWKVNEFKFFINGIKIAEDLLGSVMPAGTLNRIELKRYNGLSPFYANTKDIRVFKEALTDAQLQTLTTL